MTDPRVNRRRKKRARRRLKAWALRPEVIRKRAFKFFINELEVIGWHVIGSGDGPTHAIGSDLPLDPEFYDQGPLLKGTTGWIELKVSEPIEFVEFVDECIDMEAS